MITIHIFHRNQKKWAKSRISNSPSQSYNLELLREINNFISSGSLLTQKDQLQEKYLHKKAGNKSENLHNKIQ